MVRRVGFGPAETGAGRGGEAPAASASAAPTPEIRRNWTRIVFQCLWLDLWLIGLYQLGRPMAEETLAGRGGAQTNNVLLFAAVAVCTFLSARRLLRLLRGEPVRSGAS
jgi:hypothetical protein